MSRIISTIGNVARHFVDDSGWTTAGDVATLPEFEVGAEAWAIGKVGFAVAAQPHYQLEVTNSAAPKAGQIPFEGKPLPDWPRMYRLDCHAVQISGSVGASVIPETPVSASMKWEMHSSAWGVPILRHRANGAPPARDSRHNYVAGDPTGFLGLALGGSVGGSHLNTAVLEVSADVKVFMFGSNLVEFFRNVSNRDWRSAVSRGFGMLVARNHLQFHYTGLLAGVAQGGVLGTASIQYMAAEAEAAVAAIFVSRLHLFIHHPRDNEQTWRYVYTRHYQPDLKVSAPYKINYRAENIGIWDQAWA